MGFLFGLLRWPKLSDPMCVLALAFSSGKEKSPVGGGSRGQLLDTSWLLTGLGQHRQTSLVYSADHITGGMSQLGS